MKIWLSTLKILYAYVMVVILDHCVSGRRGIFLEKPALKRPLGSPNGS